jgi:starch-binding outer membrane protein, SusD/RagB family
MNKIFFVAIASTAMVASACSDYLDVTPKDKNSTENFYKTEAQMDQALTGVYGGLKQVSLYALQMSEQRSDNMWITNDTKQNDNVDIALFNADALVKDNTIQNCWADYFSIVAAANKLLDELDSGVLSDKKVETEDRAEARFLRALAYFDLVRYFGRVPAPTHSLTTTDAFSLGQSEAKEVYENIIVPDLRYAVDNLSLTAPKDYQGTAHTERATKNAAKGLLAKVYLTMSGFPLNMKEKKDSVAVLCKDIIDYAEKNNKYWAKDMDEWNKMWIHENDNKYFIFEVQHIAASGQGNLYTANCMTKPSTSVYCNPNLIIGNVHIYAEDSLRNHFMQTDEGGITLDQRSWGTISTSSIASEDNPTVDNDHLVFVKFFENKVKRAELGYTDMDATVIDRTYWPQNFPILRLEDVMLMYAEVVGNTAEGMRMVNKIRNRAGLESLPMALTEEEFQDAVANERRWELAGEGVRWHDLVRRNIYVETLQSMFENDDDTADKSYTNIAKRVTKDSYLYPIPQQQIQIKEGLYKQNPGY